MRRWMIVGVLCLGMAASGMTVATTALASSPQSGHAQVSHRCDGDHDADDVGCPTVRVLRPAAAPAPRVAGRARMTG